MHSQEELDAIALELNMRPRKRFDFKSPIEVMGELLAKYQEDLSSLQCRCCTQRLHPPGNIGYLRKLFIRHI